MQNGTARQNARAIIIYVWVIRTLYYYYCLSFYSIYIFHKTRPNRCRTGQIYSRYCIASYTFSYISLQYYFYFYYCGSCNFVAKEFIYLFCTGKSEINNNDSTFTWTYINHVRPTVDQQELI